MADWERTARFFNKAIKTATYLNKKTLIIKKKRKMAKKRVKKSTRKKTSLKRQPSRKFSSSKRVVRSKARSSSINPIYGVIYLVLNIIIPGLGSLVGGKYKSGIWQLALWLAAITTFFIENLSLFSFPLYIIAWVWAIVTAVKLML